MTATTLPKWTRADHRLASKIADRALRELEGFEPPVDKLDLVMDLEAAHRDCPLDLEKLLGFDTGNFGHDIVGIYRHLDRATGMLGGCFVPRCALPEVPRNLEGRFYYPAQADDGDFPNVGRVLVREISVDGTFLEPRPLDPCYSMVNHSPDGFAWGYGGSGPAQLAFAILFDVDGREHVARRLYHDFKFGRIAKLSGHLWEIHAEEVAEWIRERRS